MWGLAAAVRALAGERTAVLLVYEERDNWETLGALWDALHELGMEGTSEELEPTRDHALGGGGAELLLLRLRLKAAAADASSLG